MIWKLRLALARWLVDERSWAIVPRHPTAKQRDAGMAVVRRECLNSFAQDTIYREMVEAA